MNKIIYAKVETHFENYRNNAYFHSAEIHKFYIRANKMCCLISFFFLIWTVIFIMSLFIFLGCFEIYIICVNAVLSYSDFKILCCDKFVWFCIRIIIFYKTLNFQFAKACLDIRWSAPLSCIEVKFWFISLATISAVRIVIVNTWRILRRIVQIYI